MAIPFSCANTVPYQNHSPRNSSLIQFNNPITHKGSPKIISINCEYSKGSKLEIGSPIIVIEAPKMLKTAASVPCLRANSGLVKAGDVGRYTLPLSIEYSNPCRIVSRKPKDVWAVRLTIGTYLLDGKYFMPLELDE